MKIVKINKKGQDPVYTPVRSIMDDFFGFPLSRWDDFYRDFDNISANVWEEDNKIFVQVAMPGIKKDDIKISVTGDSLNIAGESKVKKEEKEKKYFLRTMGECSYAQTFNLPSIVNPDAVQAAFEDGLLTVTLPKTKESGSKEIKIK